MSGAAPILSVQDLRVAVRARGQRGLAVDGVSLEIASGETLGLVGESGSGKSLVCLSILRLNPPQATQIEGGRLLLGGADLLGLTPREMRAVRGGRIGLIMQDPLTALNPVHRIGRQILESIRLHRPERGAAARERAAGLLAALRIARPAERLSAWPHEFSGGMRQRVVAAIALAGAPELLIADEPTSALDVTVQAEFLALLAEVQAERGLAILLVTHDFGVVARACHRVAVMYAGRIVETGPKRRVLDAPSHPYTRALVGAVPDLDRPPTRLPAIPGQPPGLFDRPPGCAFAPRCAEARAACHEAAPPVTALPEGGSVACWARMG